MKVVLGAKTKLGSNAVINKIYFGNSSTLSVKIKIQQST